MLLYLWHLLRVEYAPPGQPFYNGATWGNVFVTPVVLALGWAWSRSKYWPLNLLHGKLDTLTAHAEANHEAIKDVRAKQAELHLNHDALLTSVAELHLKHDQLHAALRAANLTSAPEGGVVGQPTKE